MATFHVGEKTHPSVLPQQVALEFESADNPGIRHETGLERREATGVEHVREETTPASPGGGGVTPDLEVREKGRESHPYVFVLDKYGRPLQPTRPARARALLKSGRAVVIRHTPFAIRLKDRTVADSEVDGVELGVDPGSKHTGIAVFTSRAGERRARYALQLDHRGTAIRRKLRQRASYRRGRRARNLRYRAPRFLNRTRPEGWLPPSLLHRVVTTTSWVDRLARWAPVRAMHVERVTFDTHAIGSNRPLERAEPRHAMEDREYILAKWDTTCAYWDITGAPPNLDHIQPSSRGGSDRVSNLLVACIPCNRAKSNQPVEEFLAGRPERLAKIRAQSKTSLRDVAAVQSTRWALWRALDARMPTHVASSGRTKWNRTRCGLPKTHTLDALAVGEVTSITETMSTILVAGCSGRGTHARTRPDRFGFPRLRMPRRKRHFGYATGDLARAVVPTGARAGTHTGRVAVRATGSFTITTAHGTIHGIHHKRFRLLQRGDGYAYTRRPEGHPSAWPRVAAACPAPQELRFLPRQSRGYSRRTSDE